MRRCGFAFYKADDDDVDDKFCPARCRSREPSARPVFQQILKPFAVRPASWSDPAPDRIVLDHGLWAKARPERDS